MKIEINTRQSIRNFLNKNIGLIISTQDFSKPVLASNYLSLLYERGNVERVDRGKYEVLKKIKLKKKGPSKGHRQGNSKVKDLSKLPDILNSSEQGLVLIQIEEAYKKITPPDKQVNRAYLYRFMKFAKDKGVVLNNGSNKVMRISDRGPLPKRIILKNRDISKAEWDNLVEEYIKFYSWKKANKSSRKVKNVNVGKLPEAIVENFKETRDNPRKQFVEEFFLGIIKNYSNEKMNCLVVTGPDYNRHIRKLFSTIAKKVFVVEREPDVFNKISNKANICPNHINNNVPLINCDLDEIIIPNCIYMDLDLMGSLVNTRRTISSQIRKQLNFTLKDKVKFVSFTSCIRHDGGFDKRFDCLRSVLISSFGSDLTSMQGNWDYINMGNFEPLKLKFCRKHIPIFSTYGSIIDIQVITYQDTSPMMSVLVVYK